MSAQATLTRLQQQADPRGRYTGRIHVFASGEPALQDSQYVRSQLLDAEANIDMVHFLLVGYHGEVVGLMLEYVQVFENPRSAMDPQDFFSNHLGARFFQLYYRPNDGELSTQLRTFFADYNTGNLRFPMPPGLPPGGMPSVAPEVRSRLRAHSDQAVSDKRFLEFITGLETWLSTR